jgi:hypothetical protein
MSKETSLFLPPQVAPAANETLSGDRAAAIQARDELLEDMRAATMLRFGIVQPQEGVIVVGLGDKPPFAFIREVLKLASWFSGRPAVSETTLADWATDPRFLKRGPGDLVVKIEGCVPGSAGITREAAAQQGMIDVSSPLLAVAGLGYLVSSRGHDLLSGYRVMTSDQNATLHLGSDGFIECVGSEGNGGNVRVAACRSWRG